LTQRQRQLLQFIRQFMQTHGVPPSFDEMRGALNLRSKSGIHRLISGLEERGYLRRLPYRARALEVLRPPHELAQAIEPPLAAGAASAGGSNIVHGAFQRRRSLPKPEPLPGARGSVDLPLYGRIAAGVPIEAVAENSSTIDVPKALLGDGEHYVLQVVGDSMADAGIFDGDLAVIQRSETAENGQIVVAFLHEEREVTLKRLRRRGASIALEPANPNYETRIFGPNQVHIQGRLVGLLRRY
jgi:repressor LexA